jgi:putative kinase
VAEELNDQTAVANLVDSRIPVDGTDFVLTVREDDARTVYVPLAVRITHLAAQSHVGRCMVGIAGPPGAGKSSFAAILRHAVAAQDAQLGPVVVPFDGFHYPNSYLDSHFIADQDGQRVPLRAIKGQPPTFDVQRGAQLLASAKQGDTVVIPTYSRELHEPVENALCVGPDCRLCIVEGNFIYSNEQLWSDIRDMFDIRLYITAPEVVLKQRLIERHVRGGRARVSATEHYRRVDGVNIQTVATTQRYADVVISHTDGALTYEDEGS